MMGSADWITGDFLGYRQEKLVGQGGMGVVYRARDLRLKRTVALKLMAPELAADERFRERFEREAELAMSLEHPNVVPIHDAGEVDGRLYLVMRFVEGTDLRALLRAEGALEAQRALAIIAQVAHALDAAHARGLVHRDVKPSNVLLDADEHVYLADFGLTRPFGVAAQNGGEGRSLGTPAYLAPEQIEGGAIDGRADVYSLGCLLHECVTGSPPFSAQSRLALAWAHLEEEPPRASERNEALPPAIDDVLRRAMAKQPEARFATCAELVAAAAAALGISRGRRRRRRANSLVAAVVVGIAAIAGVVGVRGGDDGRAALEVDHDTLVRVDPRTNGVSAVLDVGKTPGATAAAAQTVWVYNLGEATVAEIDAETNDVRHTTKLRSIPTYPGGEGAFLAADASGAWVASFTPQNGGSVLTRILHNGGGTRQYALRSTVLEVATGGGAVWVLGRRAGKLVLIRVDPRTGSVLRRLPLSTISVRAVGLAYGGGFVWLTEQDNGTLHRIDPRSGGVRSRRIGGIILNPSFGMGYVWLCAITEERTAMMRIDPRTLRAEFAGKGLPAEEGGVYMAGLGAVWRLDRRTGTLMRFDPKTRDLAGLVPIMDGRGSAKRRLEVTSIAVGRDAVWLTVS